MNVAHEMHEGHCGQRKREDVVTAQCGAFMMFYPCLISDQVLISPHPTLSSYSPNNF